MKKLLYFVVWNRVATPKQFAFALKTFDFFSSKWHNFLKADYKTKKKA